MTVQCVQYLSDVSNSAESERGAAPEGSPLSRGAGKSLGCAAGDTQRSSSASEIIPEKKFITAVPKNPTAEGKGVDR